MTTKDKLAKTFCIRLTEEMQAYLTEKAKTGFRSVNREINMRLELSRKLEQQQPQGAHQ